MPYSLPPLNDDKLLIPSAGFALAVQGVRSLEPLLSASCSKEATAANLIRLLAQSGRYAYKVQGGVMLDRTVGPIPPDEDLLDALTGAFIDPLHSQKSLSWHVRRVLHSPQTCQFLPPNSYGFMAGGCGMLALVLKEMLGEKAQIAGLITSNKGLMHVLTLVNDTYIDAEGLWTHTQAVTKNPMGPSRWIELDITQNQMTKAGIKLPVHKSAELRTMLEKMNLGVELLTRLVEPALEV